jgi:hypothetical protein
MTQQSAGSRLPEWTVMYALHDAFRRDLDAMLAAKAGPAAVRARWAVFRDQLEFHHTAEDQVMWPPVRAKLAGDPDGLALMDAMQDEHRLIDPLLAEVDHALGDGAAQAGLTEALARLRTTLASHLAHEEADALPLITNVMTRAGVVAIFKELGRIGGLRSGLRRGAVMFPWALSEASPQTQADVLRYLPRPARLLYRAVWLPRYRRRINALGPGGFVLLSSESIARTKDGAADERGPGTGALGAADARADRRADPHDHLRGVGGAGGGDGDAGGRP